VSGKGYECLSVGSPVGDAYLKVFPRGASGSFLEFDTENGQYILVGGYPDISPTETSLLRNARIDVSVFSSDREFELPEYVFSTLLMFGSPPRGMGPMEIFFDPSLYPPERIIRGAHLHENTNTVAFSFFDTLTRRWTALRFATMPAKWRALLGAWWRSAAAMTKESQAVRAHFRERLIRWRHTSEAVPLDDLFKKSSSVGFFGEKLG